MEIKIDHPIRFIGVVVLVVAVVFGIGFGIGFTRSAQQGASDIGDLRTEFERQLREERERNTELEGILERDRITIAELRDENTRLRAELDRAGEFVGSLGSILEQDRETISDIIGLIRELRKAIQDYKDGVDNSGSPGP